MDSFYELFSGISAEFPWDQQQLQQQQGQPTVSSSTDSKLNNSSNNKAGNCAVKEDGDAVETGFVEEQQLKPRPLFGNSAQMDKVDNGLLEDSRQEAWQQDELTPRGSATHKEGISPFSDMFVVGAPSNSNRPAHPHNLVVPELPERVNSLPEADVDSVPNSAGVNNGAKSASPTAGARSGGAARSSPATSSKYCHVCGRSGARIDLTVCAKFKCTRSCRKAFCGKCRSSFKLDSLPDSDKHCAHCAKRCPPKARCHSYKIINKERYWQGVMKKQNERSPL